MTDRVSALLAEAPGLERASHLAPPRLPVLPAFEELLPFAGLRPGTTVGVAGVGATSLALALIARMSEGSWTAAVGLPSLGLRAAAELGVVLDRLIVVPDPHEQWTNTLAALVDSFDVVLASPPRGGFGGRSALGGRSAPDRLVARVRERDAVLVVLGSWPECDLTIRGTAATWHGIGKGHGHLRTRTLAVTVTGRGAAARPGNASLWLPDADGNVSLAQETSVLAFRR